MKLSKLLKIMDSDHLILVLENKSHKAIFEGSVIDFPNDKEWKVKGINNSYSYDFEIFVKEINQEDDPEALKNAPL